jgi:hypothetical protein
MQMHCYVSEETAKAIRMRAEARGIPVSRYLAELVNREVGGGWPEGYFEAVVGRWQGDAPARPDQGELEARTGF